METTSTTKHRRGDPSPVSPGLFFMRYYCGGKEQWGTQAQLDRVNEIARVSSAKQRQKPEDKERRKLYARTYNHRPDRKAYRLAYKKTPEFKAKAAEVYKTDPRIKERNKHHASKPESKAKAKAYRESRKDYYSAYNRDYQKRYYQNPYNRLAHNLRTRMQIALKCQGLRKNSKSRALIGCTFEQFRAYIEVQFKEGMSWSNYGTAWEIDHRHPIAGFNLADPEQQKQAFHFTNCQPLWQEENRAKSDRIDETTRGRHVRKIIPFPTAA